MSKAKRTKPRSYKGLRDIFDADLIARREVVEKIRAVYERYGFTPLETPAIEYVDCLGKFLPESHTPEGGIFSFKNPDLSSGTRENHPDWWLGLRYDLTAPLARVVAQYQQDLPRPFRRYQIGPVWRFEKPGPGRFREFIQFDFDTVGSSSMLVDAEACMIFCDALTALGFSPGEFQVKVNNRKVLQGVLEASGLTESDITDEASTVGIALRAIDKLDRIGMAGVRQLLGEGRKDDSGDFTGGANLSAGQIDTIERFLESGADKRSRVCDSLESLIGESEVGAEGIKELRDIDGFLTAAGYDSAQVVFDPTVVRGLGYYTGPVFEGVITKEIVDESGKSRDFGSVFGGGRYDTLVERYTGQKVPACGASVGVDRLMEAVKLLHRPRKRSSTQALVTVMDKSRINDYIKITQDVRNAGINAETYLGSGSIGKQLQYADRRAIPLAVIAGNDEFDRGEYQIKDLELGRELAEGITDRDEWRKDRPSQRAVPAEELIATLREMLAVYYD